MYPMEKLHIETPLIRSLAMQLGLQRTVWLKLDALQPSGSFKLRGVGLACQVRANEGARRFVCSSGGNAGLAVAYAGRLLGLATVVVLPETTTETAKQLLRLEGAEVIVHGDSWQEANELAMSMLSATDAFIHPFDDPLLWEGHATLIDEVAHANVTPDAVVVSVGGGGLLSGVVAGLKRNGMNNVPVVAVETSGAASFHASIVAGHPVNFERITSVASSLGAKRVSEQAMRCARTHEIKSVVVPDKSALAACERFLTDHRLLVEPACGASLALAYEDHPALAGYSNILVVVCGGATASLDQIRAWNAAA